MKDRQLLGKEIIAKIDMLIEVILSIELSNEEEKKSYQEQGSALVKEISGLLKKLIGPREEYIRDAIKELVVQRMPDHSQGMDRFSEFNNFFNQSDEPQLIHRESPSPVDPLQRAINHLFPQFNIIKNYRYQGCTFSYYIPLLKIAIDDSARSQGTDLVRKEYICRQLGITFVSINCRELPCSREMIRKIKGCTTIL